MLEGSNISDVDGSENDKNLSGLSALQNPEGDLYLRFLNNAGEELALPAKGIREVLAIAPDQITAIPNVSPILMGVLNFRGQVVWVADIGQFLGGTRPINIDRSEISIVVIESQDVMIGLAVEQVKGMEWLNLDLMAPTSEVPESMSPFLIGEWCGVADTPIRLLDPAAILRSARWAAA